MHYKSLEKYYFIKSLDTNNIKNRLLMHNSNKGAKSTKGYKWIIIYKKYKWNLKIKKVFEKKRK